MLFLPGMCLDFIFGGLGLERDDGLVQSTDRKNTPYSFLFSETSLDVRFGFCHQNIPTLPFKFSDTFFICTFVTFKNNS